MSGNEDVKRDYAAEDPRSVKAWLQGRDDGRGRSYERFHDELLRGDPTVPEDQMESRYRAALDAGWLMPKRRYRVPIMVGCMLLYAACAIYYVVVYI